HARRAAARGDRAAAVARLDAPAAGRRRDRADAHDGRPRSRRPRPRARQPRGPALGVPPRGRAVPGVRHADRDAGARRTEALLVPKGADMRRTPQYLLEDTGDDTISIVSHFGRPDEELHELGRHEVL